MTTTTWDFEPVTLRLDGVCVVVRPDGGQIRIDVEAGSLRLLPDGVGAVVEPDAEPEDSVPVRLSLLAHRGTRKLRPGETSLLAVRTETAWVAKTRGPAPRWIAARSTLSALRAWAERAGVELACETSPNVGDPARDKVPGDET